MDVGVAMSQNESIHQAATTYDLVSAKALFGIG